jgi:hypothetical protein
VSSNHCILFNFSSFFSASIRVVLSRPNDSLIISTSSPDLPFFVNNDLQIPKDRIIVEEFTGY